VKHKRSNKKTKLNHQNEKLTKKKTFCKKKRSDDRFCTWHMRRLPALRRFLAAITAATLAETEEEPLLFFFRSFLFFFRIKASSPFAIAATNSEWKRKEAVYGAATYIYAFSMGGAVIYMLLLFTAFAFCTQQKCCCTQQIM